MDEPKGDFLSLPVVFKLQIFERLHWKDINCLQLVCKDFYLKVVENRERLDREEVNYLKVYYTENKILKVDYKTMCPVLGLEGIVSRCIEFSNNYEYDYFFRNKKITDMKELVFENTINGEIINLTNIGYHMDFTLDNYYSFEISLSNGEFFSSPLRRFEISTTEEIAIPYNGTILKKEFHRKISLFERNGSLLVMKKIAMDIITGDPLMEYENTSSAIAEPIFTSIANHLSELRFFKFENRCGGERLRLFFYGADKFDVLEKIFYRKFFNKINYGDELMVNNRETNYSITNSTNCPECDTQHENRICLKEFGGYRTFDFI
uniref:F-box domain-containing protein n=1 Tax=Strongyloides papillosus TaxID=174720 RepID=A0A0N5C6X9_STREA